jgi:catechol-2,3-dioxygenase
MTATTVRGVPRMLGHLALRVRDVERSAAFYHEVLGLDVKMQTHGIAFLGIRPEASHEIALFPLGPEAEGPDPVRVGLYHQAWEMDSFEELHALHERLKEKGARIVGYSDRQCNVMFLDPDGNELEAIWEPAQEEADRLSAPGGPGLPRLDQVDLS